METERHKFYRKKIKLLTSEKSEENNKTLASENNGSNSTDTDVTVLGSLSYLDQNRNLIILMPQISTNKTTKEDENLRHCKEKPADDNIQTQTSPQIFQNEEKNIIVEETERSELQSEINSDPPIIKIRANEEPQRESQIPENYFDNNNNIITIEIEPITILRTNQNDKSLKVEINNEHLQKDIQLPVARDDNNCNDIADLSIREEKIKNITKSRKEKNEYEIQDETNKSTEDIPLEKVGNKISLREESEKRLLEEEKEEKSPKNQPTLTKMISETEMDLIRKSLGNDDPVDDIDIPSYPDKEEETENKKRQRHQINKSYVDFLSEDEDFVWDSSSWKDTGESSSSEDDLPKKKKRLQEGKVGEEGVRKKKINKRKQKKTARERGKGYVKKDGSISCEKRLHPNPCKNCGHKCGEISEVKRKNLFDHFWSLSAERKRDWLVAMSTKKEVCRKRNKDSSYRTNTYQYFINDGEGRRQVCLQFLLKTLDVNQRYVYYTLSNADFNLGSAKNDLRGKMVPPNKTPAEVKRSATDFLKSLPALPSHYCRKDSTRLYLPTEFKNLLCIDYY